MSLTFLGTASQVPTRSRNHNALFLRWGDYGLLFDPGEGTQRQLLLAGISASQITHICITHFHGDHCLGLAGVLQRFSLDRVEHSVEVIYPATGQVYFDRLRYASSYYEVASLHPRPVQAEAEGLTQVCRFGKNTLFVARLEHGIDCHGYRVQEDNGRRMLPEKLAAAGIRGPVVRQLQQNGVIEINGRTVRLDEVSQPRRGQAFALLMDTRVCAGARTLAHEADLLVSEATYLSSECVEAHDRGHLTAQTAAQLAAEAGVRRLGLTHFSQRYPDVTSFQAEAAQFHPDVFSAKDLDNLHLPPR